MRATKFYTPHDVNGTNLHILTARGNVFIMGYVTFSLGCYMVCCSVASLAVGYIYLSCSHLYSFASYDRPYALKIMSDVEDVTPANTDFPSSDVLPSSLPKQPLS